VSEHALAIDKIAGALSATVEKACSHVCAFGCRPWIGGSAAGDLHDSDYEEHTGEKRANGIAPANADRSGRDSRCRTNTCADAGANRR